MTDVRVCTDNWCFRDDCQGCPPPKPPPTDWRPEPDYEAIWEARRERGSEQTDLDTYENRFDDAYPNWRHP